MLVSKQSTTLEKNGSSELINRPGLQMSVQSKDFYPECLCKIILVITSEVQRTVVHGACGPDPPLSSGGELEN